MSEIGIVVLSDVVTFVLSLLVTMFVAGMRWGEIRRDVEQIKLDVNKIMGMFTLTLRDDVSHRRQG